MSKYATDQQFGGQRASVGRIVVVRTGRGIQAGVISEIYGDEPVIRVLSAHTNPDVSSEFFAFFEAKTEQELLGAPDGFWSWPPRI